MEDDFGEPDHDAELEEATKDLPEELKQKLRARERLVHQQGAKRARRAPVVGQAASGSHMPAADLDAQDKIEQLQRGALEFTKLVETAGAGKWRTGPYAG